jgi:DNA polymerase-3 subunit delta'
VIKELHKAAWEGLAARTKRLPHALLLHGTRGVGKLELGRRFAQFLLCERAAGDACGACEGCRWFLGDNHPDYRQIEPEAIARVVAVPEGEEEGGEGGAKKKPSVQILIGQTRALADFVNIGSHRGGRRVALIHPAEDMNTATANSLLKMLEEPPANVIFLLISHRAASLLPTIRSRCVPVPVPLPDAKAAVAWLEGQGVRNAARWLAFAGGAPLRALEYASGEQGAAIERVLRALASGDVGALAEAKDREALEPLAEVLQKLALDRAFLALTGRAKYSMASGAVAGAGKPWLAYARAMGRNRQLTRHPLNPRLFAADMVAAMPKG